MRDSSTIQTSGILSGTSYVAKDNIATKIGPTTCGSRMLEHYTSPFDATVVRLLEDEGSTLVGKANLDEFGMGSATTNSWFGTTTNPQYPEEDRVSGGSSGGSAAAVADNLCTFSLGTDTGGSVRLPASYCGVVGFKPTYGRLSRWGVVPYAQSLDTVGILAHDIDMVDKVYRVLNRADPNDPTAISEEIRAKILRRRHSARDSARYTFGVPEQFIVNELNPIIGDKLAQFLAMLSEHGHQVRSVSVPTIKQSLPAYYTLSTAEAASNLARYDGVRYGYTENSAATPLELVEQNRSAALGPEVKKRIILGNYTLSSESGDHYLQATKIRARLVDELNSVFSMPSILFSDSEKIDYDKCDFLVSPTAFGPAPTVEEYTQKDVSNFLNSYINDLMTIPASMAGLPAISVPYEGVGIQIMGQFGDDQSVLDICKDIAKW